MSACQSFHVYIGEAGARWRYTPRHGTPLRVCHRHARRLRGALAQHPDRGILEPLDAGSPPDAYGIRSRPRPPHPSIAATDISELNLEIIE